MSDSEQRVTVILGSDTISADDDIDIYKAVDHLRMERMTEDGVWFAGYTDGEQENEYNFWLSQTDEGLVIRYEITRRVPISVFPDAWNVSNDADAVSCASCSWTGNQTDQLVSHYSIDHEDEYAAAVEAAIDVRPEALDIHDELA